MDKSETVIHRIAILGPESSGKTTLCRSLAEHFKTVYAHEYVRGYLRRGKKIHTKEDLYEIAKKQLRIEQKRLKKARQFLFCDTELINLKVWSEREFHGCDPRLLDLISSHRYDCYLLIHPGAKWSQDGIRESESNQGEIFETYLAELKRLNIYCININIIGQQRHEYAVLKLEEFLNDRKAKD